jgi:transcriptional regulator with XRE-family HTH domain
MQDRPELIRDWRQSQDPPVRLEEMARHVGVTKASMSRIERGLQGLSPDKIPIISQVTGIPPAVLCPALARLFAPAGAAE